MAEQWERQQGESSQAFEAFAYYRDGGPTRSISKVAALLHKSHTLIDGWASKWKWVARVAAWDAQLDRARRDAALVTAGEIGRRQAQQAAAAIEALLAPVKAMAKRAQEQATDQELAELPAEDLLELLAKTGRCLAPLMAAERTASGESPTGESDVRVIVEGW